MNPHRRREFLRRTAAAACAAGVGGCGLQGLLPAAAQAARRLGTCGPPPRKSPERQASAEGMPPLPLPVTPLRRSEPKAEPAPPLMVAKLEYGTTQDWNTDPGDVDNLLRHAYEALGLWYGWKPLALAEVVAQHQAGRSCKIPLLYISGHEAFEFSEEERAALRQYVYDGGTLLGDACCGREEFATSFQREVRALFPQRAFDLLQIDHPVFRAFYRYATVHYRLFRGGVKQEYEGAPRILGMNVGSRTAVLFTPFDMSCGWDEHTHEHGARLLPGDAIRLGINLIAYVAAMRQVAEIESVTQEIRAPADRPRQQFVLAQLKHHGDWNPDPNAVYQWLRQLAAESSLAVSFDLRYIDPQEAALAAHPFLFMTGFRDPRLDDEETAALRRHLQAGGFLFINNCSGYHEFDQAARELVARIFPELPLAPLPADHPLTTALFSLKTPRDRQTGNERPLELEGVTLRNRLALVYSKNDAVSHIKRVSDPFGNGYDAESCRQILVNIVAYALQN
jgi:hypothetical protein